MLGDISPQTARITQQAVVYPGRDHVCILTVKRFDGRSFKPVDLTNLTRVVLVFPGTDPTIVFDSLLDSVFSWSGNTLTVDLSDYAMPASIQQTHLIVYDAEHLSGQVLVDNIDARLEFDFRNIIATGTTPPPTAEAIADAPLDGGTYGRRGGAWVSLSSSYAPLSHVGDTGAAHGNAVASGAAGFMTGADKAKLDGIASGAQVNVPTNLTTSTSATTLTVNSDTGTDAILPAATGSVAGVLTAADKTKLDGVEAGATANSADVTLLDRANHTGEQAISTVTGLQTALDGKSDYIQNNLSAVTDPSATDDSSEGYEALSKWVNTATNEIWLCLDPADGAAVWAQATLGLDDLGSAALADVGTGPGELPTNSDLAAVATSGAAADVSIVDAGSYYTATQVEGALQEVGALLGDVGAALDAINGVVV